MQQALQIRHSVAAMILASMLAMGGVLGFALTSWSGHSVLGALHEVPMFIARPSGAAGNGLPAGTTSFAPVLKPVLQAVVNISSSKVVKTQGGQGIGPFFNDPFFRQFFGGQVPGAQGPQEQKEQSLGSGVIVSPNGYILTNNHVIDGATDIKVFLPDKREFKGKVVGTDPKTDIAVVKIEADRIAHDYLRGFLQDCGGRSGLCHRRSLRHRGNRDHGYYQRHRPQRPRYRGL